MVKKVAKPGRPQGEPPRGAAQGASAPPGPPGGVPPHLRDENPQSRRSAPPPGAPPEHAKKHNEKKARPPVVIPGKDPNAVYSLTKKQVPAEGKAVVEEQVEAKAGGRAKVTNKGRPPPQGLGKPRGPIPPGRLDSQGKPVPMSAAAKAEAAKPKAEAKPVPAAAKPVPAAAAAEVKPAAARPTEVKTERAAAKAEPAAAKVPAAARAEVKNERAAAPEQAAAKQASPEPAARQEYATRASPEPTARSDPAPPPDASLELKGDKRQPPSSDAVPEPKRRTPDRRGPPSQVAVAEPARPEERALVRTDPPPDQGFKRQAPPYRPPPGAPPGKAPPRGPDGMSAPPPNWRPPAEQARFEAEEEKQERMLELVKGAPKGRRPPQQAPPVRAPPVDPVSGEPRQKGRRPARPSQPNEDLVLANSSDDEPGAPDAFEEQGTGGVIAPRDAAPRGGVPPPPREAPPVTGVPPPPADVPVGFLAGASAPEADVDAHLKRTVKAGRLRIRCVEAHNVHRRGSAPTKTKIDAFVRFTLGRHKKAPRKKTKIYRRSNHHPVFDNEELGFDLVDPSDFVANGDIDLTLELFDQNAWADELICSGNISILRYMVEAGGVVETISMKVPGEDRADTTFTGEFTFEPAVVGTCVFTLYEGRSLANMDSVGKQDPYVRLTLGDVKKQSKTCDDGGTDPYFEEEELVLWIDDKAWTDDLLVQVYDEDVGLDDLIGQSHVPLLPYMAVPPQHAKEQVFELFNKTDKNHRGELLMKLQFLPAGKLTIRCLSAKGLRSRDTLGRQDPYVVFTTSGECQRISERTHVDQDGGTEPSWNCDVEMRVVDHHELWIVCYDHDAIGSDDLIGKCKLSLLPVYKRGLIDTWVTIKEETEWGKPKPAGDIHLIFEFEAPPGIRYPQHVPGIDSFDEKDRISKVAEELKAKQIAELDAGKKEKTELADQILDRQQASKRVRTTEFTDGEIESAFKFIDLDHNGYVGAAEIRHVLVCMGELITDDEVDTMIKMVDSDGDGQVSFTEFYNVVTDPDPAHTDFVKMAAQEEDDDGKQEPGQMDAKAHERHKEITLRNKKREMMEQFANENAVGPAEVLHCYSKFLQLPTERRVDCKVDFETYCEILSIEPTGETHMLFSLFDEGGDGDVDMKEFLLGVCNYTAMDTSERIDMIFDLYDEDKSGFLSTGELVKILQANHMQSSGAVKKKAETIIQQSDKDNSGTLSRSEFDVVAQKFPSVLFPKLRKEDIQANDSRNIQMTGKSEFALPAG